MGFYMEEEEIWKCRKHPSKRATGVCPNCLRDRLLTLCPDCANMRPCACCAPSTSSSSSSSSFSLSSSSATDISKSGGVVGGVGVTGRMSNLIDNEPAFRRSRSTAFQLLRPRFTTAEAPSREKDKVEKHSNRFRNSSFWSIFKVTKKSDEGKKEVGGIKKMMRSKSVGVGVGVGVACYSDHDHDKIPVVVDGRSKSGRRSWYFPSPIKVFRQQPKSSKIIVQERSPLCRG